MAEEEERVTAEPGGDRAGGRRLLQATMAPAARPSPKAAVTGAAGPWSQHSAGDRSLTPPAGLPASEHGSCLFAKTSGNIIR